MILYPTETIYALGVNALDESAVDALFAFKGREVGKSMSWAVRDLYDIEQYAEVSLVAQMLAKQFLPGPLTLVLPAKSSVPKSCQGPGGTIGFRIPSDPVAQQVVVDFMNEHNAPLTCTSANVSGMESLPDAMAILQQFADAKVDTSVITQVVDDGPRQGEASTVVRVIGDKVEVLRQGSIMVG